MIALLRSKREAIGMTQCQLAEKLNVNQTVVSKIETCERRLDIIEMMDICETMDISFWDFFNELKTYL